MKNNNIYCFRTVIIYFYYHDIIILLIIKHIIILKLRLFKKKFNRTKKNLSNPIIKHTIQRLKTRIFREIDRHSCLSRCWRFSACVFVSLRNRWKRTKTQLNIRLTCWVHCIQKFGTSSSKVCYEIDVRSFQHSCIFLSLWIKSVLPLSPTCNHVIMKTTR